jgi:phenylacetate-CoA ligase
MHPAVSGSIVYPLLFGLRRESVFTDLAALREAQWHHPAVITKRQLERFREVAEAGVRSFEFYRNKVAEAGVSVRDMQSLEDLGRWPLMTKVDLNRAMRELRGLSGRLPAHTVRMTGGSTGDPCVVLADRTTSSRSLAVRALFQEWYGIRIGDRQVRLWGHPLEEGTWREHLKDRILNRLRLDSLALGKDRFPATLDRVLRFGAEFLYGYASLLALFVDELSDSGLLELQSGLKAAITTSETMSETQRGNLQRRLGRPIADEYGCGEVDIIAFCCPDGGRHIAAENVLVEIVQSGDEPEGYGRVVVTDLNNKLMPVIRYCIGDLAPLARRNCVCGRGWPCIGPVLGRVQDQFIEIDGGARRVHSYFVVYMLEQLFDKGWGIGRFQIVQEERDLLVLRVVPAAGKSFDRGLLQEVLETQGRSVLGSGMRWQVVITNSSELEKSASRKYQFFVNRIRSKEQQMDSAF